MPEADSGHWFTDFDAAVAAAKETHKPILLQFHREKCAGCRKLEALTYADTEVVAELQAWFVPLHLDILQHRDIRARYAAVWTPSFYVLDWTGKLHFHLDGYVGPEDFRVVMRLAKAAVDTTRGRYDAAMEMMEDGLRRFPDNPRAAAMLLRKGMAWYLSTWDRDAFRDAMLDISNDIRPVPKLACGPGWMTPRPSWGADLTHLIA